MNETVIVRGVRSDEWHDQLAGMRVYFGGRTQTPSSKPTRDADYIAFYQSAPESAITHIGIVGDIQRDADMLGSDIFYLTCLVTLDPPIACGHPISNFLYTTLEELGIRRLSLSVRRKRTTVFR